MKKTDRKVIISTVINGEKIDSKEFAVYEDENGTEYVENIYGCFANIKEEVRPFYLVERR
jgi:hypothetical protein